MTFFRGAVLMAAAGCSLAAQTTPLRLLASNGMKAVILDLRPAAERSLHRPLSIEFGATSDLAKRIEAGTPFDLTLLTTDGMEKLAKENKIAMPVVLSRTGIGLAVRRGAPEPPIDTPDKLKRALLAARSIAYAGNGASRPHLDAMFDRLGIAAELKPRIVLTEGSGPAMQSVAEGKVAVVLTLISELKTVPGLAIVGPLPAGLQSYVEFAAAVGAHSPNAKAANDLIALLKGPASAPVYAAKGMERAAMENLPQPYRTLTDWAQLSSTISPHSLPWAAVTGVEAGPDGNIYVLYRCHENSCAGRPEDPILKFDKSGKLLKSWGAGMFVFPHGSTIDSQGNFWATDGGGVNGKGHQVFKFSPDGKLLMTLGKAGVAGDGPDTFNQPTDVVIAPNGDIFVADGHRDTATNIAANNRIVKFSKDGKFIKQWGKRGTGPGEFREPHTIAMDSRGRIFVGDRMNNRIQIFDQDGRFLAQWKQFGRPSGIYIAKDDTIYVTDSESGPDTGAGETFAFRKGIRIGSAKDGSVTAFIEDSESARPEHSGAEGVGADAEGNVYGAVVRRRMLEKHIRK